MSALVIFGTGLFSLGLVLGVQFGRWSAWLLLRPVRWPAAVWRWWARVTWRLLIGRQDPHAGWYVDRDRVPGACGPEYPSFRVR